MLRERVDDVRGIQNARTRNTELVDNVLGEFPSLGVAVPANVFQVRDISEILFNLYFKFSTINTMRKIVSVFQHSKYVPNVTPLYFYNESQNNLQSVSGTKEFGGVSCV